MEQIERQDMDERIAQLEERLGLVETDVATHAARLNELERVYQAEVQVFRAPHTAPGKPDRDRD